MLRSRVFVCVCSFPRHPVDAEQRSEHLQPKIPYVASPQNTRAALRLSLNAFVALWGNGGRDEMIWPAMVFCVQEQPSAIMPNLLYLMWV